MFENRESIMEAWDKWVEYYKTNDIHGSWPRDAFESLLDHYDELLGINQRYKELYKKAVEKWGQDAQIDMIIEEAAELILSIEHWKRGRKSSNNIFEEAADLYNMLMQLREMQPKLFDDWVNRKMARLEERLK